MQTEKTRILYMEDNAGTARLFQKQMERTGYLVDLARDGEEGLAMYHANEYDVVAVDQSMPNYSGLDVIRMLAEQGPLPTTIIVTGGAKQIAIDALKLGASDYIIKDVDGEYLKLLPVVIEQALLRKGLKEEKQQAEQALEDSLKQIERAKREWESTIDSLPQIICLLDQQGRIMRANMTVEHWKLASITKVKGLSLHKLFHPDCHDPDCYLPMFWQRAKNELTETHSIEHEVQDEILNRYLHLRIQPILTHVNNKRDESDSFAAVFIDDITKRKQAEEALYESNIELQARNADLDAFSYTVAHDLKNMLNIIVGYAGALEGFLEDDTSTLAQEGLPLSQVITRNGHKMVNIINELLLLAQVRKVDVELDSLNMAFIVEQAQLRLANMMEDHGGKIILPDTWPISLGYAPWIEEVWINYLSNALKYGGQPPHMELGSDIQDDGMIRFWIRDNGPGLSEEKQAQVFISFTRLEQVRAQGHGLGLSIVQRIIEKLDGQVGVESSGLPGEGCLFFFCLQAKVD